jgi:hypothetical protein
MDIDYPPKCSSTKSIQTLKKIKSPLAPGPIPSKISVPQIIKAESQQFSFSK